MAEAQIPKLKEEITQLRADMEQIKEAAREDRQACQRAEEALRQRAAAVSGLTRLIDRVLGENGVERISWAKIWDDLVLNFPQVDPVPAPGAKKAVPPESAPGKV